MAFELVYTSVPQGIRPGSSGFCTVAYTNGLAANLILQLEGMSAYKAYFPHYDENANNNPVSYSHYIYSNSGGRHHILSRVCFYGLDYTKRSNKLAHHLVLSQSETADAAGGPASVFLQEGLFLTEWTGKPELFPKQKVIGQADNPLRAAQTWQEYTGDAGWAGVLAEAYRKNPAKPVFIIFDPLRHTDTLSLVEEALMLLPREARWKVSFNTYLTTLPAGLQCSWRFCVPNSDPLKEARRVPGTLVIDLTRPMEAAPDGELVQIARTGQLPEPEKTAAPETAAPPPPLPPAAEQKAKMTLRQVPKISLPGGKLAPVAIPPPPPPGKAGRRFLSKKNKTLLLIGTAAVFLILLGAVGTIIGVAHFGKDEESDEFARSESHDRSSTPDEEKTARTAAKKDRGRKGKRKTDKAEETASTDPGNQKTAPAGQGQGKSAAEKPKSKDKKTASDTKKSAPENRPTQIKGGGKTEEKKAAADNENMKYFWHKHKLHTLKKGDTWTAEKLLEPGLSVSSVLMRVQGKARRIPVKNGIVKVTATIPNPTGIGDDQELTVFAAKVEDRSGDLVFTVTEDLRKEKEVSVTWEKLILSDKSEIYCSFVNGKTLIDPAGSKIEISVDPSSYCLLKVAYTLTEDDKKFPNSDKFKNYRIDFKKAEGNPVEWKSKANMEYHKSGNNLTWMVKFPPEVEKDVKARKDFEAFYNSNRDKWKDKLRASWQNTKGQFAEYYNRFLESNCLDSFTYQEIREILNQMQKKLTEWSKDANKAAQKAIKEVKTAETNAKKAKKEATKAGASKSRDAVQKSHKANMDLENARAKAKAKDAEVVKADEAKKDVLAVKEAVGLFKKLIPKDQEQKYVFADKLAKKKRNELLTKELMDELSKSTAYLYGVSKDKKSKKLIKVIKTIEVK